MVVDPAVPNIITSTIRYCTEEDPGASQAVRLGYDLEAKEVQWIDTLNNAGRPTSIHEIVSRGGVAVMAEYDTIRGFDIRTGEVLWTYDPWHLPLEQTPELVLFERGGGGHFVATGPVLDERTGLVYVASTTHYQFCLDPLTGREVWRGGSGMGSWLQTFGLVGGGMLSSSPTPGHSQYILDKHDGSVLAEVDATPGSLFRCGPYYDEANDILVVYDGATVRGFRPRFEVPGE